MKIGIDATNLRAGGGVTHLTQLLSNIVLPETIVEKILLWGSEQICKKNDFSWLEKKNDAFLNSNLVLRAFWQKYLLKKRLEKTHCDILFSPGGLYVGNFRPFVTMCRNMLPFRMDEVKKFGISKAFLRYLYLRKSQIKTFKNANGLIFLTKYAQETIEKYCRNSNAVIIPHGIEKRFLKFPDKEKIFRTFSKENPCNILYVSRINIYKHQLELMESIFKMARDGSPVQLTLIGYPVKPAIFHVNKFLKENDPNGKVINYIGGVEHEVLHKYYREADMFAFPSTCENMPNILLEAMASGLPIACSDSAPMPEILKEGGIYFNTHNESSIIKALESMVKNDNLRYDHALRAYNFAQDYNWKICAENTVKFLIETEKKYRAER